MLQGSHVSTLMQIRGRRLGSEGIQPEIIQLLGIKRESRCHRLPRIQVHVRLGEPGQPFELHVSIERRKAVDRRSNKSILERFGEGNLILDDGAGKGGARRCGFNSDDIAVAVAQPRQEILH